MAHETDTDTEVQGQGESVRLREHHVVTDTVVLDPEGDDAVQVPEGIGASSVDRPIHSVEAYRQGTAEEQFAREADEPEADEPEADEPEAE